MFLSQLTSHVNTVHKYKKHHKCGSCTKTFNRAADLKIHINSVHSGQKDHPCDSCETILENAHQFSS